MTTWAPSRYSALVNTSYTHHPPVYASGEPERTNLNRDSNMPRPQNTKAKNEHLIFVKNVPADLATGSLLDLFARYEPLRVKNVYPHSDITTVVVSFRTIDEASYAQEDTDGIRLDNVVLRVEMFSKHRSVRYLREERNAHRPLGAVDEEYEEYEYEADDQPIYIPGTVETVHLDHSHVSDPQDEGATTWAQIAGKTQPLTVAPMPAPASLPPLHPTIDNNAGKIMPEPTIAIGHLSTATETDETPSEPARTAATSLQSSATSSEEVAGYEGDIEDHLRLEKPSTTTKKKAVWLFPEFMPLGEPFDSTERLRMRHCRDCAFCQMRERSRS